MSREFTRSFMWAARLIALLLLIGAQAGALKAQNHNVVTGAVTDGPNGTPLPGVTVAEKSDPDNATSTNSRGEFTIEVAEGATLVFTSLGYISEELAVGDQRVVTIALQPDISELEEVVVVGYGEQQRSHLTGAVETVEMEDITDLPVGSLSAAIAGQMPGVGVSGGTSRPGDNAAVTIRNPIILSKDGGTLRPLFVIDDVIMSEEDFNLLDPSEIKSISVLKDAAAAIYGARAAQGVVVVRTKRGVAGTPKISYSGSIGAADAIKLPDMMNGVQHASYLNSALMAEHDYVADDGENGGYLNDQNYYTADELDHFRQNNYDWLDMAWKPAYVTRHAVNVSGGTEKATYYAGASYNYQNANFDDIDVDKWTFRASSDLKVATNLKLGLSVSGDLYNKRMYFLKQGGENPENDMRSLLYTPQFNPPYVDGRPVLLSTQSNRLDAFHFFEVQSLNNYTGTQNSGLNVNANLEYEFPFLKGLKAKVLYNKNIGNNFGKQYGTEYDLYRFSMLGEHNHIYGGDILESITMQNGNRVRIVSSQANSYQLNGYLTFDRDFGEHHLSVLALFEQYESHFDEAVSAQEGPIVGGPDNIRFTTGERDTWETESEMGNLSYVGRLNYSFADKYLAEIAFRYDASTNFAPENRWGFFPSLSLGWILSEENFFNNEGFINYLKLRGSVGLMGGDQTKPYNWLTSYSIQQGKGPVFGGNGDRPLVITPNSTMANRDIRWDDNTKWNFGVDAAFLEHRLSLTANYFYDHRYNMLSSLTASVPLLVGSRLPSENFSTVDAFGYEISLGWNDKIGDDFAYDITTFLSWNDNKQIKVDVDQGILGTYEDPIGRSTDMGVQGLHYLGMFRSQQEVDAFMANNPDYTIYGLEPKPGMLYYEDIRGPRDEETNQYTAPDGVIDDNDLDFITDRADNHYQLGFNFGLSYKGLQLDVVMGASFGGQGAIGDARRRGSSTSNRPVFWTDHWTPDNPDAAYPNPNYHDAYEPISSFWFKSSTTIRMRSFNLSYTLPSTVTERLGMGKMRMFLVGTNPISFYNPYSFRYNLGSYNSYPTLRTLSFGLNLEL